MCLNQHSALQDGQDRGLGATQVLNQSRVLESTIELMTDARTAVKVQCFAASWLVNKCCSLPEDCWITHHLPEHCWTKTERDKGHEINLKPAKPFATWVEYYRS